MRKINRQALACIMIIGFAAPMTAMATNGYFAHGYGTKNKGLAGGGVALPQDAMIAATNPAGMVLVGDRMDVGVGVFSPSPRSYTSSTPPASSCIGSTCSFTLGAQSIESENDYFLIPHFAYNWMLGADRSAGVTVYGNGGMNTEYSGGTATFNPGTGFISQPGTYGAGTAGVNLSQLFINMSYAVKFGGMRSVGAGLIFAYQEFEAKGLNTFGGFSTDPSKLSNNGKDSSTGFGLKLGVQDEIGPGISFGASYQTKTNMSKFDKYKGLFAQQGDFDIPATITLGIAMKTSPTGTITFDLQKIYYSDVPAVGNPIGGLFPPGFGGACTAGATGGTGTGCLGGADGAGFGWRDMTIMKFGYQWASGSSTTYRLGYSKGNQPIPESEVLFNILAPAVIEEHLTFGMTQDLGGSSEVNFTAMYAKGVDVTGPNDFDLTGGSQTITLKMDQIELELSYSKKF